MSERHTQVRCNYCHEVKDGFNVVVFKRKGKEPICKDCMDKVIDGVITN